MANALQMVSNPNPISLEKLAAAFHAIHGGYHRLDESHCSLLHMPRHKFWTKIIKKKGGKFYNAMSLPIFLSRITSLWLSPFSLVFPLYDYLHLVRFDVLRVRRSQESTGCCALPFSVSSSWYQSVTPTEYSDLHSTIPDRYSIDCSRYLSPNKRQAHPFHFSTVACKVWDQLDMIF